MRFVLFAICVSACLLVSPSTHADDEPAKARARSEFARGSELAQQMRWGEALSRFEASARLHPDPGTTYNIGVCHRALGHFTRAERAFRKALSEHRPDGPLSLPEHMLNDTRGFLDEIGRVLARIEVELSPATARITLDGRPLEKAGSESGRPLLLAGLLPVGPGRPAPASRFVIVADPGTHVLLIARKGYTDIMRRIDLGPGARERLKLELAHLPGELEIASNQPGSAVSVDGLDVGVAPVFLKRPAGPHRVVVRKPSFVSYSTVATVAAGEHVRLDAELAQKPVLLTERWWFWAGLSAVVVGIGVGTYYATRPDPERPAVPSGSLGWTAEVP
jgi:hypothetical protein